MTGTPESSSWRRRLLNARMDLTPLRTSRDFRTLFWWPLSSAQPVYAVRQRVLRAERD